MQSLVIVDFGDLVFEGLGGDGIDRLFGSRIQKAPGSSYHPQAYLHKETWNKPGILAYLAS